MNHRHLLPDEIDLLLDDEVGFGVAPLKAHVRDCARLPRAGRRGAVRRRRAGRPPALRPVPRVRRPRDGAGAGVRSLARRRARSVARWLPQSRSARHRGAAWPRRSRRSSPSPSSGSRRRPTCWSLASGAAGDQVARPGLSTPASVSCRRSSAIRCLRSSRAPGRSASRPRCSASLPRRRVDRRTPRPRCRFQPPPGVAMRALLAFAALALGSHPRRRRRQRRRRPIPPESQPLQPQDSTSLAQRDRRSVARRRQPSPRRRAASPFGDRSIAANTTVDGPIAVARGNLDVYGTIDGDAVTLDGDIRVHHGGRVTGDAWAAGGTVVDRRRRRRRTEARDRRADDPRARRSRLARRSRRLAVAQARRSDGSRCSRSSASA